MILLRTSVLIQFFFYYTTNALIGRSFLNSKRNRNTEHSASFLRIRERLGNLLQRKETPINNLPQLDSITTSIESISESSTSSRSIDIISEDGSSSCINNIPTILTDDICLLPGEPIVRIEIAPQNTRRIFTAIDIFADVESVWKVLTDYQSLHLVVPSLIKNEVVELYPDGGARLYQVGGANVLPGITFKASVLLDIRIHLENNPLPASKLHNDTSVESTPTQRDVYPRPYAITSLPVRDITMQNVIGEGDFDHYQGIWRLQSLPNCAPNGTDATRLTYAVEIRPKGFLPVALIEKRVATDLQANMEAIRTFVEARYQFSDKESEGSIFERNLSTESIDDNGKIGVLVTEVRDLRRRVEMLEKQLQSKQRMLDSIGEALLSESDRRH